MPRCQARSSTQKPSLSSASRPEGSSTARCTSTASPPDPHILLDHDSTRQRALCRSQVRPLRGDHIHQAFAVYVHGELVDIVWDQEWLGTADPSEGETYPLTFRTSRRECARSPYRTPIAPPPSPCTMYARTKRVRLDAAALTPHTPPAGTSITSRRRTRTSACMRGRRTGSEMG